MKNNKIKIFRIILSIIVIAILIRKTFMKEWFMVFSCFYTLIIFSMPRLFNKKFKIKFNPLLEISIYLFVFCAEILGEIDEYYITYSWWDDLLHFTSGMLFSAVGLSFIDLIDKRDRKLRLPIIYKIFGALCFTMTLLSVWECFEFGMDKLFDTDMQKDRFVNKINSVELNKDKKNSPEKIDIKTLKVNDEDWINKYGGYLDIGLNDTMYDLLDGFLGAFLYLLISYIYLKKKEVKNE